MGRDGPEEYWIMPETYKSVERERDELRNIVAHAREIVEKMESRRESRFSWESIFHSDNYSIKELRTALAPVAVEEPGDG